MTRDELAQEKYGVNYNSLSPWAQYSIDTQLYHASLPAKGPWIPSPDEIAAIRKDLDDTLERIEELEDENYIDRES